MQISLGNIAFKLVTRRSNGQQNAPILQWAVVRGEKERARKSEKGGGKSGRQCEGGGEPWANQLSGKLAAIKRDINNRRQVASSARECSRSNRSKEHCRLKTDTDAVWTNRDSSWSGRWQIKLGQAAASTTATATMRVDSVWIPLCNAELRKQRSKQKR